MKVVVTDYVEKDLSWEEEELRKHGIEMEAYQLRTADAAQIAEATADADIVVVNMARIDAAALSGMERCRLIIRHGIGYDNVDVEECTRRGILVANQPYYCVEDVAEHTVALILACARRIVTAHRKTIESAGRDAWDFSGIMPLSRLKGKTVGLLGTGRIARLVARKLSGFEVKIIGFDPYLPDEVKKELDIEFVPLDELFKRSDFLSIHVPLTDETRGLVDARAIGMMKPSACIVNTARGGIVDTGALREALATGRLAAAGIDAYEKEPPEKDYPLFDLPNVILTPHMGWASVESEETIRRDILEDILRFARGETPQSVVNPEALSKD